MKNWINSNGLSVGIITLFILIATGFYSAEENYLFWTTGTKEKAFLNTTWGMSKKEVKRSNRTTQSWPTELKGMGEVLWNVKIRRDHISTPFFPRISNPDRYSVLQQKELHTFGESTTTYYYFFDDRLFHYSILITNLSDSGRQKTLSKLVENISKRQGDPIEIKEQGFKIFNEWDNSSTKVVLHTAALTTEDLNHVIFIDFQHKASYDKIREFHNKETENIF